MALGRAWHEAWEFVRSRIWWGIALFLAGFAVNILRIGLARWFIVGAVPSLTPFQDSLWGAASVVVAILLTWLWHLILVTPARTFRDDRLRVGEMETQAAAVQAAHQSELSKQPNLSVKFNDQPDTVMMEIRNSGATADRLDVRVDSLGEGFFLVGTHFLASAVGVSLPRNAYHDFRVAGRGAGTRETTREWRLDLRYNERSIQGRIDLFPNATPKNRGLRVPVRISVTCRPENKSGPIEWLLTFHERGCDKELITPLPA